MEGRPASQQGEGALRVLATGVLVIAISLASLGATASTDTGAGSSSAEGLTAAAPVRCPDAREGVAFYRQRYSSHRAVRGIATPHPAGRKPRNCADAHYLAEVWTTRAFKERRVTEEWVERFVLNDFPFGEADPWPAAVEEVQRLFPGTEAWLLSCADAEGWEAGRTSWIGFSGVPYSEHLRDSDTVGGPLQFRFSTFKGMWRHAVEFAHERGYRVPRGLLGDSLAAKTRAWRSALGQAMAGGWARYTDNDDWHWIASWANGCR